MVTIDAGGYEVLRRRGKLVPVHRLLMEQHLGKPIPEGYVVHHKDGNKRNNRIENLELMTHEEHTAHHASARGKRRAGWRPHNAMGKAMIYAIRERYSVLRNYSAVARELGISNMTVRKHVLENREDTP